MPQYVKVKRQRVGQSLNISFIPPYDIKIKQRYVYKYPEDPCVKKCPASINAANNCCRSNPHPWERVQVVPRCIEFTRKADNKPSNNGPQVARRIAPRLTLMEKHRLNRIRSEPLQRYMQHIMNEPLTSADRGMCTLINNPKLFSTLFHLVTTLLEIQDCIIGRNWSNLQPSISSAARTRVPRVLNFSSQENQSASSSSSTSVEVREIKRNQSAPHTATSPVKRPRIEAAGLPVSLALAQPTNEYEDTSSTAKSAAGNQATSTKPFVPAVTIEVTDPDSQVVKTQKLSTFLATADLPSCSTSSPPKLPAPEFKPCLPVGTSIQMVDTIPPTTPRRPPRPVRPPLVQCPPSPVASHLQTATQIQGLTSPRKRPYTQQPQNMLSPQRPKQRPPRCVTPVQKKPNQCQENFKKRLTQHRVNVKLAQAEADELRKKADEKNFKKPNPGLPPRISPRVKYMYKQTPKYQEDASLLFFPKHKPHFFTWEIVPPIAYGPVGGNTNNLTETENEDIMSAAEALMQLYSTPLSYELMSPDMRSEEPTALPQRYVAESELFALTTFHGDSDNGWTTFGEACTKVPNAVMNRIDFRNWQAATWTLLDAVMSKAEQAAVGYVGLSAEQFLACADIVSVVRALSRVHKLYAEHEIYRKCESEKQQILLGMTAEEQNEWCAQMLTLQDEYLRNPFKTD